MKDKNMNETTDMKSFPDDIVNTIFHQDLHIEERCANQRTHITEIIRRGMRHIKQDMEDLNVSVVRSRIMFGIEPEAKRGTSQVRKILSKELKERFPQLKCRTEIEEGEWSLWTPVPDDGYSASEYLIELTHDDTFI